jgi:hypothetical protein
VREEGGKEEGGGRKEEGGRRREEGEREGRVVHTLHLAQKAEFVVGGTEEREGAEYR